MGGRTLDAPLNRGRDAYARARNWVRFSEPLHPAPPTHTRPSLTEGFAVTTDGPWVISPRPVKRAHVPNVRHLGTVRDPRGSRADRRAYCKALTRDAHRRAITHRVAQRKGPKGNGIPLAKPRRFPPIPIQGGAATTWYVRKTGNDNNGGTSASVRSTGTDGVTNGTNTLTSAGAAWTSGDIGHGIFIGGVNQWRLVTAVGSTTSLTFSGATIASGSGRTWTLGGAMLTVSKLLAGTTTPIASGDTVYIGAGTYRETVAVTSGIAPSATTSAIGDVDGVKTGDSGEVRITAYTTNDTTAPSATVLLALGAKNYWAFSKITFSGGNAVMTTNTAGSHDCSWTDCTFLAYGGGTARNLFTLTGVVDGVTNYTWERCISVQASSSGVVVNMTLPTSTTADYNASIVIRNCLMVNATTGLNLAASGANSFKGGGVSVSSCTFAGPGSTFVSTATNNSSVYPVTVVNSVFVGGSSALTATTLGQIVEDYNLFFTNSPRSTVNAGIHSISDGSYAPLIHLGQENQYGARGRAFGVPMSGSPLLGFGNGFLAVGSPGTMGDDATVGTIVWANPNNAKYNDGANFATGTTVLSGDTTHYLKATNFGFAVPSDAVIQGVRVEVSRDTTVSASNQETNSVKLVKGGAIGGNDKATATNFTNALVLTSYGAENDLWGNTFAASDINASTFGVVFSVKQTSATAGVANVDYIRIVVSYTSASSQLTVDLYNRPRPAGGGSALNAVGALERGNTFTKETGTVHTGANAISITGPGYQDFEVPVDAVSTTVSVYVRRDSTYAGTAPSVQALNGTECGVANQTVTDAGAANAWNQISITIVPTSKGIVTVRLLSSDTNGGGEMFVDSFSFS